MAEATCPLCKKLANRLDERCRGDHSWFDCPRCGLYEISGSFSATLSNRGPLPVLSGVVRHAAECGDQIGMLTSWNEDELEARAPKEIPGKARQVLEVIRRRAPDHGQMATLDAASDYPLAYGPDENALRFILEHMVDEQWIGGEEGAGKFVCRITAKGWDVLQSQGGSNKEPGGDLPSTDPSSSGPVGETASRGIGDTATSSKRSADNRQPIEVFTSYSHRDERRRHRLDTHLALMKREKLIASWFDHRITPGRDFDRDIAERLECAQIILLLVSPEFIASDYCWHVELQRAIERHEDGNARVIPIIVRPCDWQSAPFGKLKVLPRDGKAVAEWRIQDKAYEDVAKGIRAAVDELNAKQATPAPIASGGSKDTVWDDSTRLTGLRVSLKACTKVSFFPPTVPVLAIELEVKNVGDKNVFIAAAKLSDTNGQRRLEFREACSEDTPLQPGARRRTTLELKMCGPDRPLLEHLLKFVCQRGSYFEVEAATGEVCRFPAVDVCDAGFLGWPSHLALWNGAESGDSPADTEQSLLAWLIASVSTIELSETLPRAIRLAQKIDDKELEKWARLELYGYSSENGMCGTDEVPEYRTVVGRYSDMYGHRLFIRDPDLAFANEVRFRFGVRELEGYSKKNGMLYVHDAHACSLIRKHLDFDATQYEFNATSILGILDSIRRRLLDWLHNTQERTKQGPAG